MYGQAWARLTSFKVSKVDSEGPSMCYYTILILLEFSWHIVILVMLFSIFKSLGQLLVYVYLFVIFVDYLACIITQSTFHTVQLWLGFRGISISFSSSMIITLELATFHSAREWLCPWASNNSFSSSMTMPLSWQYFTYLGYDYALEREAFIQPGYYDHY